MVDPFQYYLDKKTENNPFHKYLRKKEIMERVNKELTPAIRSYVKASFPKSKEPLTSKEITAIVEKIIEKNPPKSQKVIERIIEKQIIKKEEKPFIDIEARHENERLKQELENLKEVIPFLGAKGGSGVMGLPNPQNHSGQFLTTDGNAFSFATVSSSSFTQAQADLLYVKITGSVMTGDLEFPSTGFIMNDGTNRWRVTILSTGNLVTTLIAAGATTGQPMGLLLALTYPT